MERRATQRPKSTAVLADEDIGWLHLNVWVRQNSTSKLGGWVLGVWAVCPCVRAMEMNLALFLSYCLWTQIYVL